jgi:hypothetical protein
MDADKISDAIIYGRFTNDELNLIIGAVKQARALNGRVAKRTLGVGQQVKFRGRAGVVSGVVESIKIKNAVIVTSGGRYRVPLSMLESVA